jgi:hypothetical protein
MIVDKMTQPTFLVVCWINIGDDMRLLLPIECSYHAISVLIYPHVIKGKFGNKKVIPK